MTKTTTSDPFTFTSNRDTHPNPYYPFSLIFSFIPYALSFASHLRNHLTEVSLCGVGFV